MQTADPSSGVPLTYAQSRFSQPTRRRANGLKAVCVSELLIAVWGIAFTNLFWVFLVFIPIDILGIIAARRMQRRVLTAFTFLKALLLGFLLLFFADVVSGWVTCKKHCSSGDDILFEALFMTVLLVIQLLGVLLSVRLRKDILIAENISAVELSSISEPQLQQLPLSQLPTMTVPQHFQDPSSGVAGYPYPPPQQQQYYPMYMNQQAYPSPYAHYPMPAPQQQPPHSPIPTYPSFSISEEQQHQQQFQQQQQQQQQQQFHQPPPQVPDTQPLLYPH